jgi:capsular exopolysaccharide synthesis family protein
MSLEPDRRFGGPQHRGPSAESGADDRTVAGIPLTKIVARTLQESPELVVLCKPRSVAAERFWRLRSVLLHKGPAKPQVIVVTSGIPRDGKSTVAFNLALAFAADEGKPTLLLDADLRRPAIGRRIEPAPEIGLGDILTGRVDPEHVVVWPNNTRLRILPACGNSDSSTELLSSDRFKQLVGKLRQDFSRIIIDTPPIVPFTDADVVGSVSDGVVMVVSAGVTPVSVYRQAIDAVTSTKVLGTVLNRVVRNLAEWNQHYDKYYSKYYDAESEG